MPLSHDVVVDIDKSLLEQEKALRQRHSQESKEAKRLLDSVSDALKKASIAANDADIVKPLSRPATAKPVKKVIDKVPTPRPHSTLPDPSKKSFEKVEKPTIAQLQNDDDATLDSLGDVAARRFLKAKVQVLTEALQQLKQELETKTMEVASLQEKYQQTLEAQQKLSLSNQQLQTNQMKMQTLNETLQRDNASLQSQLSSVTKERDALARNDKQSEREGNARLIKLNRALEDVEKYKNLYHQEQQAHKDAIHDVQEQREQWSRQVRRLEKQKGDLILGFKKQMQLIDVLQRQKIHLEAAKWLQFTEEEFIQTLSLEQS